MIKKKNYKVEEHFTELHSFTIYSPENKGARHTVYYKRYREKIEAQKNVYDLLNNKNAKQDAQPQKVSQYPNDRTLELMSFDGSMGFLKKHLRKIGKIRKMDLGEGIYKSTKIWTAIVVFKFQFDLVKCFRDEYLQTIMDEQTLMYTKQAKQQDREQMRIDLIHEHMGEEMRQNIQKLKKMKEGGFQVVTDKYGQYKFDYEKNQQMPQSRNKKKKKVVEVQDQE